jgi:hypothetical protein
MNKRDLHSMETKEMIKCEGCGGYHTLDESEVIVIKIIKGKGCAMPKAEGKTVYVERPNVERTIQPLNTDAVPTPITPIQPSKPRKNIIPPGIASMMIPTTHPQFEQLGAKEHRIA